MRFFGFSFEMPAPAVSSYGWKKSAIPLMRSQPAVSPAGNSGHAMPRGLAAISRVLAEVVTLLKQSRWLAMQAVFREIGRASCRERGCQDVLIVVVHGSLK